MQVLAVARILIKAIMFYFYVHYVFC